MENIIYNELRIRGYSVDVGQVKVRIINDDGKKIRKLLEMDFICNSGNKRVYIQSVLDTDGISIINVIDLLKDTEGNLL